MATTGIQYPSTSGTNSIESQYSPTGSSSQVANPSSSGLATESAFLQLLVAQLKNQDPMQPMDGTTFVTQLAQFNDVEQNIGTRTDLDAISEKFLGTSVAPSNVTSTAGGTTTTSSTGTSSNNSIQGTQGS